MNAPTDDDALAFYRGAYTQAHERAEALEASRDRLFELSAQHTEAYGIVCAERDAALLRLSDSVSNETYENEHQRANENARIANEAHRRLAEEQEDVARLKLANIRVCMKAEELTAYAGRLRAALVEQVVEVISTVGIVGCKLCGDEEGPNGLLHKPDCLLAAGQPARGSHSNDETGVKPRAIPPRKMIDPANVTDEDCADLAACIERENVKKVIADTYTMIGSTGLSLPYKMAFESGIEELEYRLLESWGENPNTAGPKTDVAALSKKCCGDYLNCKRECAERGLAFNSLPKGAECKYCGRAEEMHSAAKKRCLHGDGSLSDDCCYTPTAPLGVWNPVASAPPNNVEVLVMTAEGNYCVADCAKGHLWNMPRDRQDETPTHWMAIPAHQAVHSQVNSES